MHPQFTKRTDNAPLIAFRILFGLLLAWNCVDYLTNGSINKLYIKPKVTFTFIGFEWLQPLPGNGMYWYYGLMAVCALGIAAGLLYRYSLGLFTILFAGSYFMQKTVYNNHHYFLLLLCIIMLVLPANRYASLDSYHKPSIKRYSMPQWYTWIFILQIAILYFFASVAKLYPDWLNGTVTGIIVGKFNIKGLNFLLHSHYFHLIVAYGGILFDLLIVPLLLIKKTRKTAAILSVGFHTFNWLTLNIGIFPFLSLSYLVFFFPPDEVRKFFFKKKPALQEVKEPETLENSGLFRYFFIPYFIIQLALPVRHLFIKGDVIWTEEGHRLSWRMMLRQKTGTLTYKVIDKKTGKDLYYTLTDDFTPMQIKYLPGRADMIWQAAQIIKENYVQKGTDVAVYTISTVSLNRHAPKTFIDPETDLGNAKWNYFGHNDWVLLYDDYYH